jgi:hypothetical protein
MRKSIFEEYCESLAGFMDNGYNKIVVVVGRKHFGEYYQAIVRNVL